MLRQVQYIHKCICTLIKKVVRRQLGLLEWHEISDGRINAIHMRHKICTYS